MTTTQRPISTVDRPAIRPGRARAALVLVAVALVAAACSGSDGDGDDGAAGGSSTTAKAATTAAGKATTTSNPYGAGTVDPPGPDDTVLTVTGPGGTKEFTLEALSALGTKDVTIDEPFVKRRIAFTGVPMKAIFDSVGIAGAVKVRTKALNDYEYNNSTAADFVGSDGLIAVAQDGGPVPVDAGGPIRIIFPDGTTLSKNLDAWNWSLASMGTTGS